MKLLQSLCPSCVRSNAANPIDPPGFEANLKKYSSLKYFPSLEVQGPTTEVGQQQQQPVQELEGVAEWERQRLTEESAQRIERLRAEERTLRGRLAELQCRADHIVLNPSVMSQQLKQRKDGSESSGRDDSAVSKEQ